MRGTKGVAQFLVAMVLGLLVGGVMAISLNQASIIRTTSELYQADVNTLNLFYQARNLEDYFGASKVDSGDEVTRAAKEGFMRDYVNSGGPRFCGFFSFNGKGISIWSDIECLAEYSYDLSLNETEKLIKPLIGRYATTWGVAPSSKGEEFCLRYKSELTFGKYESIACFDVELVDFVDEVMIKMFDEYNAGSGTCVCEGTYEVCWTEFDGYNFTYATKTC